MAPLGAAAYATISAILFWKPFALDGCAPFVGCDRNPLPGPSALRLKVCLSDPCTRPLHIELIEGIQARFSRAVDRESRVSALSKKIARGDRFVRTAKNTFGCVARTTKLSPGGSQEFSSLIGGAPFPSSTHRRAVRQGLGPGLPGPPHLAHYLDQRGEQNSWSADYFLHERCKWRPQELFAPVWKRALGFCRS